MHRKTNSMYTDYLPTTSKYSQLNSYNPSTYKFSTPDQKYEKLPTFKVQEPIAFHSSYKTKRTHTRNHSDLAVPPNNKTERDQNQGVPADPINYQILEKRIQKLQAKIIKTEKVLFQWTMEENKKINDKIIPFQSLQVQTQNKHEQILAQLSELRNKIEGTRYRKEDNYSYSKYHNLSQISQAINEKVNHKLNGITMELMQSLKSQIKNKINQLSQKLRNTANQFTPNADRQILRSSRKYFGAPICFVYQQHMKVAPTNKSYQFSKQNIDPNANLNKSSRHNEENICISQIIYYIDPEGYLLDQNNHYLLNGNMKQIKLSQKQLRMLRKMNVLVGYS